MKHLYLLTLINLISLTGFAQCNELIRHADKVGDRLVITTTSTEKSSVEPIQYKRVNEKGQVQFFVLLFTEGGSSLPQKGATVIFKDGAKIEWTDAVVESMAKGAHYTSQCVIRLAEEDIEQFQEKEIARVQLHTHEHVLNAHQSLRAKTIINCVIFADLLDIKSDRVVSQ